MSSSASSLRPGVISDSLWSQTAMREGNARRPIFKSHLPDRKHTWRPSRALPSQMIAGDSRGTVNNKIIQTSRTRGEIKALNNFSVTSCRNDRLRHFLASRLLSRYECAAFCARSRVTFHQRREGYRYLGARCATKYWSKTERR